MGRDIRWVTSSKKDAWGKEGYMKMGVKSTKHAMLTPLVSLLNDWR